jgi:hypothetical protein
MSLYLSLFAAAAVAIRLNANSRAIEEQYAEMDNILNIYASVGDNNNSMALSGTVSLEDGPKLNLTVAHADDYYEVEDAELDDIAEGFSGFDWFNDNEGSDDEQENGSDEEEPKTGNTNVTTD